MSLAGSVFVVEVIVFYRQFWRCLAEVYWLIPPLAAEITVFNRTENRYDAGPDGIPPFTIAHNLINPRLEQQ